MKEKLEEVAKALAEKAKEAKSGDEAMKYAQAVLNLVNATRAMA